MAAESPNMPASTDLDAYHEHLAAHPDAQLGTMPARLLLARTKAAIAEREQINAEVIAELTELCRHIAQNVRVTLALVEAGDVDGAKDLLQRQVDAFDRTVLLAKRVGNA